MRRGPSSFDSRNRIDSGNAPAFSIAVRLWETRHQFPWQDARLGCPYLASVSNLNVSKA
ncbi:hypothetical protein SPHINGOT1_270111 [Sphingomonas sp. T1]|nr:hypothetical protein SPHINGOT1_270111 [Sphingomonas sp. T1]